MKCELVLGEMNINSTCINLYVLLPDITSQKCAANTLLFGHEEFVLNNRCTKWRRKLEIVRLNA